MYNWDPIGARVVSLPAWRCWRNDPWVYESEDEDEVTPFEESFDGMVSALRGEHNWFRPKPGQGGNPFFAACRRLDILSRRGRYGVVWLGLDDGDDPRAPAPGLTENHSYPIAFNKGDKAPTWLNGAPPHDKRHLAYRLVRNAAQTKGRKLLFLKPFPESQAQVTRWEGNRNSPRYLQPLEYVITEIDPNAGYSGLGLPSSQVTVHWSRCVPVADTYHHAVPGSGTLATPAMQVPLHDILDARKVSGASPEGFYRGVIGRLFFETHEQFGPDAIVDADAIADMMEELENSSQKHGVLRGMHANQTATPVNDPTPHEDGKLRRIAIHMGKPKRIFEGSERGELSSAQDERDSADDDAARQNGHCTPNILAPLINTLISVGVLVEPDYDPENPGFTVEWPPLHAADDATKATVFSTRAQAFAAALGGNVPAFLGERNFLIREAGFTAEEADQMLEDAEREALEAEEEQQAKADELGLEPAPPPGFKSPEAEEPVKVKEGEELVLPSKAVGNLHNHGDHDQQSHDPRGGGGAGTDGAKDGWTSGGDDISRLPPESPAHVRADAPAFDVVRGKAGYVEKQVTKLLDGAGKQGLRMRDVLRQLNKGGTAYGEITAGEVKAVLDTTEVSYRGDRVAASKLVNNRATNYVNLDDIPYAEAVL